jgi:hypothetical protein
MRPIVVRCVVFSHHQSAEVGRAEAEVLLPGA